MFVICCKANGERQVSKLIALEKFEENGKEEMDTTLSEYAPGSFTLSRLLSPC